MKTMKSINAEQFKSLVGNKFFSVQFIKKNGELRDLNGRLNVQSKLRGGADSTAHMDNYVNVYEGKADSFYRKVNMNTVQQLKVSGETYVIGGE